MASKLAYLILAVVFVKSSQAISCYSCESSKDFSCSEFWDPSLNVNQQYLSDCRDVYDAKYCVKMTGVYDGKLGTKRFCSSRDWGNYCEYIQRPGDPREYRSCILTCTSNECNSAGIWKVSLVTMIITCMISIFHWNTHHLTYAQFSILISVVLRHQIQREWFFSSNCYESKSFRKI